MGNTIASRASRRSIGMWPPGEDDLLHGDVGKKVEERLAELLERSDQLLQENRAAVFAVAHALESHRTLSGVDVEAVIEGKAGRGIDGRVYKAVEFLNVFGEYHSRLVEAHVKRVKMAAPLPKAHEWAPEFASLAANGDGSAGSS